MIFLSGIENSEREDVVQNSNSHRTIYNVSIQIVIIKYPNCRKTLSGGHIAEINCPYQCDKYLNLKVFFVDFTKTVSGKFVPCHIMEVLTCSIPHSHSYLGQVVIQERVVRFGFRMPKVKGALGFSIEEKTSMLALRSTGYKYSHIAKQLNRDVSAIRRFLLANTNEMGKFEIMPKEEKRGRKRKTDDRDDREIVKMVKQDRFITAKKIKTDVPALQGLSLTVIRDRIRACGGMTSRWAVKKPFISSKNQTKRLEWAKEHLHWTKEQWRQVLWTDESPFVLRYNGRRRVWRLPGERNDPKCCTGSVKHDKTIMIWGCFAAHGVGILHLIDGIMDQHIYLDIVENCLLPSADLLFGRENWIFQQDNDPKHTARRVKDFITDNDIPTFGWPAQSPDLNPIENLWSILDKKLVNRKVNTTPELFKLLKQEWNKLTTNELERLVDSMPQRCQAVIDARGLPTKY